MPSRTTVCAEGTGGVSTRAAVRLGDVLGIIADPFQHARGLQRADDLAQVLGHRLPQRQHRDGLVIDEHLELVDPLVIGGDAGRLLQIALAHRVDRIGQLSLGQPAHFGDQVLQPPQLLVEGPDDVFRAHASTPYSLAAL